MPPGSVPSFLVQPFLVVPFLVVPGSDGRRQKPLGGAPSAQREGGERAGHQSGGLLAGPVRCHEHRDGLSNYESTLSDLCSIVEKPPWRVGGLRRRLAGRWNRHAFGDIRVCSPEFAIFDRVAGFRRGI